MCAERTSNIFSMVVTLDVSKLSDSLNALASCRIKRKAYAKKRGARCAGWEARGRGAAATSGMHGEGP